MSNEQQKQVPSLDWDRENAYFNIYLTRMNAIAMQCRLASHARILCEISNNLNTLLETYTQDNTSVENAFIMLRNTAEQLNRVLEQLNTVQRSWLSDDCIKSLADYAKKEGKQ